MAQMRGLLLLPLLLYASHASAGCGIQKTNVMETSEEGLVSNKEFPWVVSLQDSHYAHLAFGSILSEFWILSIASAFQNRKDTVAIVGIAKTDARVIAHEEYPVNTIIIHEDFNNETMANNIALLKTDTAMQFNNLVQSICFLSKELHMLPALQNCWVAGWNPTTATGNHMTMSILRKISVKDIDLCPLHKFQKTGCGNHIEEETDAVCLGDPGNPMMCQLQQFNLWVLKGIVSQGGETCPGLFLYIKVEDYSDWITSKTERTSLLLSSFNHRVNLSPFSSSSSDAAVTQETYSGTDQVSWPKPSFQEPGRTTTQSRPANSPKEDPDFRKNGLRVSGRAPEVTEQPVYYDYYDGESGKGGSLSGQNRLHQPQEVIWFFSVLVSFAMIGSLGANPPN